MKAFSSIGMYCFHKAPTAMSQGKRIRMEVCCRNYTGLVCSYEWGAPSSKISVFLEIWIIWVKARCSSSRPTRARSSLLILGPWLSRSVHGPLSGDYWSSQSWLRLLFFTAGFFRHCVCFNLGRAVSSGGYGWPFSETLGRFLGGPRSFC